MKSPSPSFFVAPLGAGRPPEDFPGASSSPGSTTPTLSACLNRRADPAFWSPFWRHTKIYIFWIRLIIFLSSDWKAVPVHESWFFISFHLVYWKKIILCCSCFLCILTENNKCLFFLSTCLPTKKSNMKKQLLKAWPLNQCSGRLRRKISKNSTGDSMSQHVWGGRNTLV